MTEIKRCPTCGKIHGQHLCPTCRPRFFYEDPDDSPQPTEVASRAPEPDRSALRLVR